VSLSQFKSFLTVKLLVGVTFLVFGHSGSIAQQPFEFRDHNMKTGLQNNHINVLSQTDDDHLVIGHREGLSTFDGASFRNIKTIDDTTCIGEVLSINKREDGSMLIGTTKGRIFEYFNGELIKLADTLPSGVVSILRNTRDREELFLTRNMEVLIRTETESKYVKAPVIEILLSSAEHVLDDKFLVGTNEGLFAATINFKKGFRLNDPVAGIPNNKITALLHEPELNQTWVATEDEGLFRIQNIFSKNQTQKKVGLGYKRTLSGINQIIRDRFGSLWLSTFGKGLHRLDNWTGVQDDFTLTTFNTSNGSISNDLVKDIYQDTEGNLWVGTYGNGLTQIVESVFYEPFDPTFLEKNEVNCIHHDSKGRVWIGIDNGIFMSESKNNSNSFKYFHVSGNSVNTICEDRFGTIWIGTPRSGLWKLNPLNSEFKRVRISNDPLSNYVNQISVSSDGVIVSTKGGLYIVNSTGDVKLRLTTLEGLPHNNIKSAIEDSNGRVWIGSKGNRVCYFSEGKIRFIEKGESKRIVDVNYILEDEKKRLWFGTNGNGLHILEGSLVTNLTTESGLASDFIYSLIKDKNGLVWALHQMQVSLINDTNEVVRTVNDRDFTIREGSEITSASSDNKGNTWITTSHGIIKYNPRVNELVGNPPNVEITELFIMNEPRELTQGLILPYKKYNLRFSFAGISLRNPEGLKYRYLLEGFNEDWSAPMAQNSVQFPRLENGDYTLKIISSKQNSGWSAVPATYSFTIKKPFWKTRWFLGTTLLFIFSVVFLFIKYRTYKLVQDNLELEKVITLRTSEIQTQKEEIEQNRDEIKRSAKDITDSIKYAKRIQKAIFPANLDIKRILPDSFIFFRSKGIVSGDFYFVEEVNELAIFAAVDCTGHGVPGAFISIVANNLLKQAVLQNGITKPSEILDFLNRGITETLHQTYEESTVRDGLDIALCTWDKKQNEVQFAGAFNPMYIFRNGELEQFKGNRFPVGVFVGEKLNTFTNQVVKVEPGDMLFIFSDGFADQFGGPDGKKMKLQGFRDFLMGIHKQPVNEQYEASFNKMKDYQGNLEQVDDIIVMGIRIS
jgi:ligand-binding sensor domain-containing protein/serine phosphatase RsbU (regulator of sigma subunit)